MAKTLHSKLLFFFLLVTFLPMIFMGYISYQSQKEALTKQLEQNLIIFADSLAVAIEDLIGETFANTIFLAKNPVMRNADSSIDEIKKELVNFRDAYNIYQDVIFVDKNGIVSVDILDNIMVGNNLSQRHWFKSAIQEGVFFSDIYLSPILNRPVLVLGAAVKDNDDNVIGVVSPSLDFNYLWQRVKNFSNQQNNVGLNGYAFIVNGVGDIIIHPEQSKILRENYFSTNMLTYEKLKTYGDRGTIFHENGKGTINSVARIKAAHFNNDWYVIISVPKSELYAPLQDLLIKYLLLYSLVLIIITIAVIKLSKFIVKPVQQLVTATSDFALGKKVPPLTYDTYEEVNTLNKTFNIMMDKLQQREKEHKKSTLILETTDNGVLAFNKTSYVITSFNNKCEQLFNIEKQDAIGKTVMEVSQYSKDFKDFIKQPTLINMSTGNNSTKKIELESIIGGKQHSFLVSISFLPSVCCKKNEANDVLLVFRDISEKLLMEREMVRAEKLKLVGQLAAGFAHEIRNPLATIKGFMQLFDRKNNLNNSDKEYYQIIIKEIERIDSIITDLLNMAKPATANYTKETDLNELIDETVMFYKPQGELSNIAIITAYQSLPLLKLNSKQIKQVFVNIIKNAFEAMPAGGTLTITTNFLESEQAATIAFTDTGCGMDKETMEKLGTPFYTTKETGTGLGLLTSFRLIEEMKGTLHIESELGAGSTFMIWLPINT